MPNSDANSLLSRGSLIALPFVGLLAFSSVFWSNPAEAQNQTRFDGEEAEAIEEIVRQYLMEHPEVIVDAIRQYQERERLAEEERQREAIIASLAELKSDPASPVLGNPDGDVVLVEFFDYRCPYCKVTAPRIQALIDEDPNLKVVMKEFPILSEQSLEGARAALAAGRQNKYAEYHFALMQNPGDLSERHLRRIAQQVGVDEDQLIADMRLDEIQEAIERNHRLARAIGVRGTPAFVVGDTLVPGAVEVERLRELISATRNEAS